MLQQFPAVAVFLFLQQPETAAGHPAQSKV